MTDPTGTVASAVDEAIRLTVWRNVRRYIILGGIAFVIIDLVITLTVVILLAISTRHSDLVHAQRACKNTQTLALIQHTTVSQQARNTDGLIKSGYTFGLSKEQFQKLYAQSKAQQKQFLDALDELAHSNCTKLK